MSCEQGLEDTRKTSQVGTGKMARQLRAQSVLWRTRVGSSAPVSSGSQPLPEGLTMSYRSGRHYMRVMHICSHKNKNINTFKKISRERKMKRGKDFSAKCQALNRQEVEGTLLANSKR